jgi:[acyl-carrier-protein] S-malonyltransferase
MRAYVYPGQGTQFPGMGKNLYENSDNAKKMFDKANEILGFSITDIMFGEDVEALKQTEVTQPSIFIYSVILTKELGDLFSPDIVAGHSLGEFSALVASQYLSFEDGLILVSKRAKAMQKSCEDNPSTMAVILGVDNKIVEDVCLSIEEIVVPANYNCPGQLVISGTNKGIDIACDKLIKSGARRAMKLPVSGAFHSPLMESARLELELAIKEANFQQGICPIYQNVTASPITNKEDIKVNLTKQLTASVMWTQTMQQMKLDGLTAVSEVGPGKVLQGLFKKIDRDIQFIDPEL